MPFISTTYSRLIKSYSRYILAILVTGSCVLADSFAIEAGSFESHVSTNVVSASFREDKQTVPPDAGIGEKNRQDQDTTFERMALRRKLSLYTFGLLLVILTLIIIGYIQKRRDNKKLSRQKEAILEINKELEVKNKEIARQRDEMKNSFGELENTLEKLKKAQRQLIEVEKMASVGQLTAGIAHEINNPINFVSSNVTPLRMNIREIQEVLNAYREATNYMQPNEKVDLARELEKKYDLDYLLHEVELLLNGISEGASRTKEIVLGLRNFSRINEHELRNADIHDGLESTLVLLKNEYKNRIEIIRKYDLNPGTIECYPGQLNQVFMNILGNAIQAIRENGTITIRTKKEKGKAVIRFADTGHGITRENLTKIFDPFFTTKNVGEGTGLGLSISYGIIQQHNGDIQVTSRPGKGTTFKLTLPLKQPREIIA